MRNQKRVNVVAAVIKHSNEILAVQRGTGKFEYLSGKFEFPGGKIEQGESPKEAVVREIREELCQEFHGPLFHSRASRSPSSVTRSGRS
ncbi:MAG: NUDIX domain-containing protein [Planctomycetaceae bacterium]|nr:NUDIX domain-containing protein [Planctomycetaceae bacterium]